MAADLLAPSRRPRLAELAASRLLLAFDYDGVLAPLVLDPHGRRMRPGTRRLLRRVAARYPVAVVSGRGWRDLRRFVPGEGMVLVGNHGFELGRATPVPRSVGARLRRWTDELDRRLADVPGWYVEHKRSTLSVHWGLADRPAAVGRAVHGAAARLRGVRLVPGKNVLNVIPADFPTKGDALLAILSRRRLDAALFLGDDVTDEDAFRIGPPRVVGVKVGPGRTAAGYRLRQQEDVDRLLALLVDLRPAP